MLPQQKLTNIIIQLILTYGMDAAVQLQHDVPCSRYLQRHLHVVMSIRQMRGRKLEEQRLNTHTDPVSQAQTQKTTTRPTRAG